MRMLQNPALVFDVDDVLRAQGADPGSIRARSPRLVRLSEEAMEEGLELLQPKVYVSEFAVSAVKHERMLLEGSGSPHLDGKLVLQHLLKADRVHALLCTIGSRLDARIADCMNTDPAYALALDGVGSAAVEALSNGACRRLAQELAARQIKSSIPLSPGMVGWPVEAGQPQIFRLFEGEPVDVHLNASFMMTPRKSLSMVVGSGTNLDSAGRTCDYCAMKEICRYQDHYTAAA